MALFFLASLKEWIWACLHLGKISNREKREVSAVKQAKTLSTEGLAATPALPGMLNGTSPPTTSVLLLVKMDNIILF
jgi:hypothetical protein